MANLVQNQRWEGHGLRRYKATGQVFSGLVFENLVVRLATLRDCRFQSCVFKNCYLGSHVKYFHCTWVECRFQGKYSALGANSLFDNCRFEDVAMQTTNTDGSTFRKCVISGKLRNMIWRGAFAPTLGRMVLDRCDLTGALLENVNIYAGLDLSSTILPDRGIRVFHNPDGAFSAALRAAGGRLEKNAGIPLDVLGNADCYARQDPVIFDLGGLSGLLDMQAARTAFETVASTYEIIRG